jgi:CHAD domain-containing protein
LAGAARDLDVALENVHDYRKHANRTHRADLKEIEKVYDQRRRDAYVKLIDYLDSAAHESFVTGFVHFTATPGAGVRRALVSPAPPTPIEVCHILPPLLQVRFARIRAFTALFAGDAPPAVDTLHALRIECKYLRYAIEFGRHLLGAEGDELIEQLKRLQDLLGGINDAAVERQRLIEWQAAGMDNPAVRGRLADLQQRTQTLSAETPAVFAAFIDAANRRRLALAIARI